MLWLTVILINFDKIFFSIFWLFQNLFYNDLTLNLDKNFKSVFLLN